MLSSSFLAAAITLASAVLWLRFNDFLAGRGIISSQLSRKIIHTGTGPIFVLCWLLFPGNPYDRYLAAIIPGLISIQFALVGFGIIQDEDAVQALSRSGDRREILRGPLFYGIIFVVLTSVYWVDSPIGVIGLMLMCGGDGLADIFGRRFGNKKLPWSAHKSWAGLIAMFVGGWVFALAVSAAFIWAGIFPGGPNNYIVPISIIALAGTIIESLPTKDIDNLTVTVVAVVLGHLFF